MEDINISDKNIIKICLLAGQIMLQSGAETHRVEDTMNRIAAAFDVKNPQSYATPTSVQFSIAPETPSHATRITKRTTDLYKITKVNQVSRQIAAGLLTIDDAIHKLHQIAKKEMFFSIWMQIAAAALASACFVIMFGGTWFDFLPAFITGGIGFASMLFFERVLEIRFISEFSASVIIGLLAVFFVYISFGLEVDKIIIGAVMPLVPGLPITNAVRDLMAGHLVAGLSKGVEALLTATAIGAGVAVIFALV
ncbi:threonine/serine exporter family protein [Virgibacillus soli]|uniref:Threonine/serine exporter family protein n=1 Tax=Paracerasibacillus soli TaxID=480284 RepID=A0ABU5CT07_9BACI|nr:threonine/serine exporter family protein [Virgibacillus soli]MDY0409456.1 threonine/serine exporter family protein [Virgibacillus soli]